MAKKKRSGPNKSQAIRDYLKANPGAKPKEIVVAMKKKGISVSAQFVSTIKTNAKKNNGITRKPGRPPGSKTRLTGTSGSKIASSSSTVSVVSLMTMKEVVEELGSIQEAKAALETLERLST